MTVRLEVQRAKKFSQIPAQQKIQQWVDATLKTVPMILDPSKESITIRFIDTEESRQLNETYRKKIGPTNVLSFPDESIPGFESDSLGEIALCVPIVLEEAKQLDKITEAHFAHLVVHGVLHLIGYDHIKEKEAQEMEALETSILLKLGFANPY